MKLAERTTREGRKMTKELEKGAGKVKDSLERGSLDNIRSHFLVFLAPVPFHVMG